MKWRQPAVLVEKGAAVQSTTDPHLWTFTTTVPVTGVTSVKIVVDVADLAGQITERIVGASTK